MDYEGSRLIAITGLGSRLLLKPKENILPAGSIFEINKNSPCGCNYRGNHARILSVFGAEHAMFCL